LLKESFELVASINLYRLALRTLSKLVNFLSQLTIILPKQKVNTISNNLKLLKWTGILGVICLCLLPDIGLDPVWLDGLLALMVDELTPELEACAHKVLPLEWQFRELGVGSDNVTHDLHLLLLDCVDRVVNFNIGLERFLN
jgi:hypothetical protein